MSIVAILLTVFLFPVIASAQSSSPKKDIPAIAQSARGAIVTIVMANDDKPIARGTGFLVSPDGAILTNYHVIVTGNVAIVKFADGTVLPVDGVLATDKFHDVAILKIHGKIFPALTLGNSDQLQVGEGVVAIGNPLGLELTVSNGILSGIRSDEKDDAKLLQITAPISHGSSGGPLFNMFGDVIGINALYLEGGESLNFAIPINDAKKLLQNDSARLNQLPNESEAHPPEGNSRPDASSGASSDASSPKAKESGVAPSSHDAVEEKKLSSYYVKSYQHGSFIIEHDGRQLLATCREALAWERDGTDKLGGPMATHDCMYLPSFVRDFGKHVPDEQIWLGDKELRFEPFGHDKVDVADVLDIIAEAPIGSPLRRPTFKTSPEILKTLRWIQNTLADGEGRTLSSEGLARDGLLDTVSGCQVTFIYYQSDSEGKTKDHFRQQVSLGDLDPASLAVTDELASEHIDIVGPVRDVVVDTTDKVPAVRVTMGDWSWRGSSTVNTTSILWQLPSPYAVRFGKALRQAITLCGGKPSTF
jgi:hypothetical protein